MSAQHRPVGKSIESNRNEKFDIVLSLEGYIQNFALSAVSDISVNNVVLLSAPDFNQSLFQLLHVIEHKLDHSVLNFGSVVTNVLSLNEVLSPFSYREPITNTYHKNESNLHFSVSPGSADTSVR